MITTIAYSENEAIRLCCTINEFTKPRLVASFKKGHSVAGGGGRYVVSINLMQSEWDDIGPKAKAAFKARMNPTLTFDPE